MLVRAATKIVFHEKEKLAGAVAGVALAVFLVIVQWGFYFGYQRDITVVLDAFDADVWIVPKGQPSFDTYVHIDDLVYWRMRQHPGIATAARVAWGDAAWRNPVTGGKDYVQVLGVEFDQGIDLAFAGPQPDLGDLLSPDGHICVAEGDRAKLGIGQAPGARFEISGREAKLAGFVEGVNLFTTAGFILTDLDNARAFLRVPPSHATYMVGKFAPGADPQRVVAELQRLIPEHDVMLTRRWHTKAKNYWETRSGFGPVILLSSVLGVLVGFLIMMLTFYISTLEKIPLYACLKALGASTTELVAMLAVQVAVVFVLGAALGGATVMAALAALRQTTISIVISQNLVLGALAGMLLCSAFGALLSVRKLSATEPGEAFRT